MTPPPPDASTASAPPLAAESAPSKRNWESLFLIIGVVGLAVSLIGLILGLSAANPRPFFGWMIGATFWFSTILGMLLFVMLFHVFDAGWAVIVRRQMEHALGAMKWLWLIFLPLVAAVLIFQDNDALPWIWIDGTNPASSHGDVQGDVLYQAKAPYLNLVFFALRFFLFFGIFTYLAERLRRHSYALDTDGDAQHCRALYRLSAGGLPVTGLALSFFAIDFFKSLQYHWFSTMYGVWFFAASARAALAAIVLLCAWLAWKGYLKDIFRPSFNYLLGSMLLAFTVFWTYISFSQYFLIYNANIPEETFWFNLRLRTADYEPTSWYWVAMALIFLHFLAPFLWLLWYKNKFGLRIVLVSAWIFAFHLLDLYWNILPQKRYDADGAASITPFVPSIWDLTALVGVGGICLWAFLRSARQAKPIPVRDPLILESVNHHV